MYCRPLAPLSINAFILQVIGLGMGLIVGLIFIPRAVGFQGFVAIAAFGCAAGTVIAVAYWLFLSCIFGIRVLIYSDRLQRRMALDILGDKGHPIRSDHMMEMYAGSMGRDITVAVLALIVVAWTTWTFAEERVASAVYDWSFLRVKSWWFATLMLGGALGFAWLIDSTMHEESAFTRTRQLAGYCLTILALCLAIGIGVWWLTQGNIIDFSFSCLLIPVIVTLFVRLSGRKIFQ